MIDAKQFLRQVVEKSDEAAADENCRRLVVRAVYDALRETGFIVENPRLEKGERDEVVIMARKPTGNNAKWQDTG